MGWEYYSAPKKEEALLFGTWPGVEDIVPSETAEAGSYVESKKKKVEIMEKEC